MDVQEVVRTTLKKDTSVYYAQQSLLSTLHLAIVSNSSYIAFNKTF